MRKQRAIDDSHSLDKKRLLRDVRPIPERIVSSLRSGPLQLFGIFSSAGCLFVFPAATNVFFPLGLFFFILRVVCVKEERLPFRMPKGLSGKDKGDPLPGRKGYAKPSGMYYFGQESSSMKELWLKPKDILTHTLLFGTTGSGKTEALVSLSYNALATGSGFFYIDPKAAPKLAFQAWQMARYLGRDDDFRVLNYGTSGKEKGKSPRRLGNTNNPFAFGSAEALTQLLISLMPRSEKGNSVFADKAQALIIGVMYALVDLRDKGIIKLSIRKIREALGVEECFGLAMHKDLSSAARESIQAGLKTCGWIAGKDFSEQPPAFLEQFGYAQSYFGKTLSSLADVYSHIYSGEDGEVDFADAIMQRRILVVMLPSLEKSPAELENLGKISLSSIRTACAVGLGSKIEGSAADTLEALPTDAIGIGPYLCIVDEYAAIVTPGFEVVLTQGRGLGIAAIVASQDYAGIYDADPKGAQQMVANTFLKVFLKLQDAEKTWSLIRNLTDQSTVLRTTGFEIKENRGGSYRDSMSTTIEKEDRVNLRDLQEQIEGEAHFVFDGQIVRGDMFYANPNLKGTQLRVPQMLQVEEERHD